MFAIPSHTRSFSELSHTMLLWGVEKKSVYLHHQWIEANGGVVSKSLSDPTCATCALLCLSADILGH